jgi:hypothetical protein
MYSVMVRNEENRRYRVLFGLFAVFHVDLLFDLFRCGTSTNTNISELSKNSDA